MAIGQSRRQGRGDPAVDGARGGRQPEGRQSPAGGYRVGVISDTHGVLRPQVIEAFRGCDLIIHAGDIDSPEVLAGLEALAPVTAVRGNMDAGSWATVLPRWDVVEIGAITAYVLHDVLDLDLEPLPSGIGVVISGHTHRAETRWKGGVLYVNPGSAGAPRLGRRPSVAVLHVKGASVSAELVEW